MESRPLLNWSLPLFRVFGLEVRLHWTWFLLPIFAILWAITLKLDWWLLPVLVVVPFVSVLLHEFGHAFMARLVGGESELIVMWALGGLAMCEVPASPGRRFAVSAAGPLVTFVIYALCALTINQGLLPTPHLAHNSLHILLGITASMNLTMLLFNLLPAYPLDGGSMLRSALWPLLGLHRAIYATIIIAYVMIAGLATWAVITSDLMLFAVSMWMLAVVVKEHVAYHRGFDPLGLPDEMDRGRQPLLASWMERRKERRREREERTTAAEQDILDRLLAKVSQHGLTALTEQERATLQRISKRQRDRQTTGFG